MPGFADRLDIASRLEKSFIAEFNARVDGYQIVKYGIETTQLAAVHKFIRFCHDDTSRFVRYIPDSVLVRTSGTSECDTTLIEFKAATTGVKNKSFLLALSAKCPNMEPPFSVKEDVFNIENDALELYLRLQSIGVRVAVIAYAGYRASGDKIRAQFVEKIAKCNTYNPNVKGQNTGSGTYIANINFASFELLESFFFKNYGIGLDAMKEIAKKVEESFA